MTKTDMRSILRFTLPTIAMMIFMSLYTMVDGIFISKFVGTNAFSAVNIVYPAISGIVAIGVMLGTGGNAIIAKNIGENQMQKAKERFTAITLFGFFLGVLIIPLGIFWVGNIVRFLGATDLLYEDSVSYLRIIMIGAPFGILQLMFQSFFVTTGKPLLGLKIIIAGGVTNIVLDYLFIVVMNMGMVGAGLGTLMGYCIPGIYGLFYFSRNQRGLLYFIKPSIEWNVIGKACFNGSSEMVTHLANAVTTFLFNIMMLRYYGEEGVAAITIVLYVQFFLSAVYIGYSIGVSPLISYHFGKKDWKALGKVFKLSFQFIAVNSVVWFVFSLVMESPLIRFFVQEGSEVYEIASQGWKLFAISFLLIGFNVFASAWFTAFSDGKTSAMISFLRTFVFLSASIIGLPLILGANGIWMAISVAEIITLGFTLKFFKDFKNRYPIDFSDSR